MRQKLKLIWRVLRGQPVAFRVEVGPGEIRGKDGAGLYIVDFAIIRDREERHP